MLPFVPITAADLNEAMRVQVERDLPGLDYGHRVAIAWLATEHPDWDAMRINNYLVIEHDVRLGPDLIAGFLDTIR